MLNTIFGPRRRVLATFTTNEGVKLRKTAYIIPDPSYHTADCTQKNDADPRAVIEGLMAAALENANFCVALDLIERGLCGGLHRDHNDGIELGSLAGEILSGLVSMAHRDDVLPLLIRASELTTAADTAKFVDAWNDPARRDFLRGLSDRLGPRAALTDDGEKLLRSDLISIGLRLRPIVPLGKSTAIESFERESLRQIISRSSRGGG